MQYRSIGQLRGAQAHAVCRVEASVPVGTGLEWRGPVRGVIELSRSGASYSAQGALEATALVPCSRCAATHEVLLRCAIAETVVLEQIDAPAAYQDTAEGAGPIPILNGDRVDLSELVRQMLLLHVPPWSLCGPECRGLCPHCGTDLNENVCRCATEPEDARLDALRSLL
jgi:uncharacterized protein